MLTGCRWPRAGRALAAGIFALTAVAPPVAAADEALRERFLSEAPRAWEEYAALAEHLRGTVSFRQVDLDAGGKVIESHEQELTTAGPFALIRSETTVFRSESDELPHLKAVNSRYAFQLKRVEAKPGWRLLALERLGPQAPASEALRVRAVALHIASRGLRIFQTSLPDIVRDPGFSVRDVRPPDSGGESLVRVNFDYEPQNVRNNPVRDGTMVLDPQRYWMVRSAEAQGLWTRLDSRKGVWVPAESGLISVEAEYQSETADFPVLDRYAVHIRDDPAGIVESTESINHEWTWEYDLRETGRVDEGEFTLSAFGLPEPALPQPSRVSPWLVLAIAGTLLLALGLFLRQRLARR